MDSKGSETRVYCGSPLAIAAAVTAYPGNDAGKLTDALIALHDPGLGLDRSVCLRDVVEALRAEGRRLGDLTWHPAEPAAFIERVFGACVRGVPL